MKSLDSDRLVAAALKALRDDSKRGPCIRFQRRVKSGLIDDQGRVIATEGQDGG